ncbi:MAG: FAD-dependent thymidylate synthase [bacterium]|nr:FAD-dependent thymidylate synthase [bacterium]MDO8742329.1 FAD-dependent thymidylate synthase [bacterium]
MDPRVLELRHVTRELTGGGFVLILNTGAVIDAEAEAMLQALHSRSVGGIRAHLKTLAEKGPERFMKNFYVGYGHKSIGDCGTGTIFIEGVSMLVAKAIQDWLLYSGQEASTRYIDFLMQKFIDLFGLPGSMEILEEWRSFYASSQNPLREHLRECFPRNQEEDVNVYEKAINARSFDILRGFLPAGATTNLSWHTNLRQAADHIAFLRCHPLREVHVVAEAMESALQEAFPSSFGHKRYEATEKYHTMWMREEYYFSGTKHHDVCPPNKVGAVHKKTVLTRNSIDINRLEEYKDFLVARPEKTELPKQMAECGAMQFEFLIDFGSFRDIQRHRSVIQRMPLLSSSFGVHSWYFESLPDKLRQEAEKLVRRQLAAIDTLPQDRLGRQYYLPMGMCVPCRLTGDLPALVYVVERRAQRDVHPTLHEVALEMADDLLTQFGPFGLTLNVDREKGRFDVKRGLQDIVQK